MNTLIERIRDRNVTIGIIGLGYVGLPLVEEFAMKEIHVVGFDINSNKVKNLKQKYNNNYIKFCDDIKSLSEMKCDVFIICVPTPLKEGYPDISYIKNAIFEITPAITKNTFICLESTTYPGTTREVLKPLIEEKTFLKTGKDVFIGYSPERIDPGNKQWCLSNTPKIVSGITEECLQICKELYGCITETIPVSSPEVAETVKLFENTYRAVNIALVNELKMFTTRIGISIWEVIKAAATKPFGFKAFYPGPGFGGHCIPIDPIYLAWKARSFNVPMHFIELASEINANMHKFVVSRIQDALNNKRIPLKDAKILIIGVAYKPNLEDTRESPATKIIDLLQRKGALVTYYDPHISEFVGLKSVSLTDYIIKNSDCVVIITNHTDINYDLIESHAKLIIDTRGQIQSAIIS